MARTDLRVTIDAEAAKLEREIQRTSRAMQKLETDIRRADLAAAELDRMLEQERARALENMGRRMMAFGAATLAGLGLATKAAMDWESSWTGVLKTVEGTPEQLARVEDGLRGLATELPATHAEIAAVAQVAGQLGIATDDVVDFTRVMINLGETTNLSAEEAATSLARMMNVMQTAPADVERLGSTLVDLGNNAATTERDILLMAQRISGAGAVIGLSEADVLAFATALSSVGIEAQAGGTAMSRVMVNIANAVASGGEAVEGFAEVAGMSASEFARAFEEDPARAIDSFVTGLGRINTSGGNVFETLQNLGLGEIRVRDALLRLASTQGIVAEQLDRSSEAWADNTALIEEAELRYDTTEAKIAIARNTLIDLAIDIGGVILPMVSGLAEGAADLFRAFSNLPGPVIAAGTVLAGLVGTAALLGGSFLLMAPRIAAARAEMQLLSATSPGLARGLRGVGRAAGIAAGVVALVGIMEAIHQASVEAGTGVGEMTEALLKLREGEVTEAIDRLIEKRDALSENSRWRLIVSQLSSFGSATQDLRHDADELSNELESVDNALVGLVQAGELDAAEEAVQRLGEQFGLSGDALDRWVQERLPGYLDALAQVRSDNELTAESMEPVDERLVGLANRFQLTGDDAAEAAQSMLDAWRDAGAEFVDIMGAYNDALASKEEDEREAAQAAAEAAGDVSGSWEDMVGDVKLTVDEYIAELERQVEAQSNWSNNMIELAGRIPPGMFDELMRLGPEGAPLVQMLTEAGDSELARIAELWPSTTGDGMDAVVQRIADAEPELARIAREEGQEVADQIRQGMIDNGTTVFEEAKRLGLRIDEGVGTDRARDIPVTPFVTGGSVSDVQRTIGNLVRTRTMTINVRTGWISGVSGGSLVGHSGGLVTNTGIIPRMHNGGPALGFDEVPAILQTGERVLSRGQNRAFEQLIAAVNRMPASPVSSSGTFGGAAVIRFSGDGALFDQIQHGVRTGSLRLTADGAPVRVG